MNINRIVLPLLSLCLISACSSVPNELSRLNKDINNAIKYKREPMGKDYWQSPNETTKLGTGDCEDYAILKLSQLNKDLYLSNIVIVWSYPRMEYHALTKVVDKYNTVYYLDNLNTHLLNQHLFNRDYEYITELPLFSITKPAKITRTKSLAL